MKKSLIALAALGSFAGMAHAQSSVTLYGIVDVGIMYTSNVNAAGKSLWRETTGNESGSRFGLMGAEDLGGGTKAIFRLENGFNTNTGTLGQGGRMFGRQAYVGLSNADLGTLTLGRQYGALQDYLAPLPAASVLAQFANHPYDNDNLNNSFRIDNSVKYATPNISGFKAEALYAFSNSTGFANNRAYSVGASYANGPLNLGAAYLRSQHPGVVGGAIVGNPSATTTSNPMEASASRVDQWGAGGTYGFGPLTLGLLYTGSLYTNSATPLAAAGGTIHFQNYDGSIRYALTPALLLVLGEDYTSVHQSGVSGHFWQTNAGADYNLSKRTDVFLNAFYQKASHNLHANIEAAGGAASGQSQTAVVLGMRHKF